MAEASDQSWRARLSVSATMMSLLVALVTVLTAAVPAFKSLVTPENSALLFAGQGGTATTVSILVSNKGIRAGSVRSGSLVLDNGALLTLHIFGLDKNEPRIVEPGKSELIKFYSEAHLEAAYAPKDCLLRLISMDFLGARREDHVTLDCREVQSFLSAHGP
jgi:hypothetical protein